MSTLSTRILLLAALGAAALGTACDRSPPPPEVLAAATRTARLQVEGMTCASCKVTVRTAVNRLEGIGAVEVDVQGGTATVRYDPERTSPEAIAAAITRAGYPATVASGEGA